MRGSGCAEPRSAYPSGLESHAADGLSAALPAPWTGRTWRAASVVRRSLASAVPHLWRAGRRRRRRGTRHWLARAMPRPGEASRRIHSQTELASLRRSPGSASLARCGLGRHRVRPAKAGLPSSLSAWARRSLNRREFRAGGRSLAPPDKSVSSGCILAVQAVRPADFVSLAGRNRATETC